MRCRPYGLLQISVFACLCASLVPGPLGAASPRFHPSGDQRRGQPSDAATVTIPGPLRSFLRMAAISQKVSPDEVLPSLARNISLLGFNGASQPTEYLVLLRKYMQQAKELNSFAGPAHEIRVSSCNDAKFLLQILGYRTRPDCGHGNTVLQTDDPQRAFVTTDSGFPLSELEKTLQGGDTFTYSFPNSVVPVFLTARDWIDAGGGDARDPGDLLETLLHDPALARLYYAWARMDPETQAALQQSPGLRQLVPYATSLDFYGSYLRVRSGHVVVPGGERAEPEWKNLVGASPDSPGEFILRLLEKDNGWLAAYFDSLSRVPATQQAHFTDPPYLKRFYEALRGKNASPSATRSVFRPNPNLLLLITRVQWEPNGDPRVPGNLQVWNRILSQKTNARVARRWGVKVGSWKSSHEFLESLFAFSRIPSEGGPCQAYLVLSELDSRRSPGHRLSPQTVELLAGKLSQFSDQYLIFSEFPELDDGSIATFLETADSLGKIPDRELRGNTMGTFEAMVGLWQILARQGQIADSRQNDSWRKIVKPFAQVSSAAELFDSGRHSLGELLRAATGESQASQDKLVDLIAGPAQTSPEGQRMHRELADRIQAVLNDQRLVSVDTLSALGDGINAAAMGSPVSERLFSLADELQEFQMPRPIFTRNERTVWTAGTYNNHHTDLEMRTDLGKILKAPASSDQFSTARGKLAPFLRDTLVGLNYAYYEPPGAQAVHNNPLLVRSHDFSGETVVGMERYLWQIPRLFGEGSPAGGGAHLVGSMAELPYVLARIEKDFIAPENVQALIWTDLVPGLMTDAVLPRWWSVSRNELHAIALYQRAGEELLAASAGNDELRGQLTNILSDRMLPHRLAWLDDALREGRLHEISPQISPADTLYLTAEFRQRYSGNSSAWGPAGHELESLTAKYPAELSWERLSQDFGVPHPILAATYARELLNVGPFPVFEGYSSRVLAETWDSTNLYWARLADDMGYPPLALNGLVPQLTVRMVARIFASDLNDSPAILRAMREVGEEFQRSKVSALPTNVDVSGGAK